ncbi:MAG: alpha/beta hydrolase [Acidobacteria bacterium]|nr:alpha/beta hydrolase [Acidobacteriota bacterium]
MPDTDLLTLPVVHSVPGMEAVEVRRDLVYRRLADGTERTMDVYQPPGLAAGERRPGVVFVHGGPVPEEMWTQVKGWGIFTSYGRLLAASGFVAATFNHRFLRLREIEEPAADIAAALSFLREGAEGFALDPDRLAIWAFSGGGPHLAPFLRREVPGVRCLVAYYTLLDLRPIRERVTGGMDEELAARFSPVAVLPDTSYEGPPLLIARAGLDQPWINDTIDAFVARALAANAPLDVLNHPRGRHGFDVLDADERSREILARTLAFVGTNVGTNVRTHG